MRIWGIHKKYKSLSWWENFMGGHVSIGPITIFGSNAMNWVAQIKTKKYGFVCFTLPVMARWQTNRYGQRVYRWHLYFSPNGTPWASTFYIGSNKSEHITAKIRKLNFGHNFNVDENYIKLRCLNDKFGGWFTIDNYEAQEWAKNQKQ